MSFPITFQHDSMQCGIACLQMICRHFGRKFSLDFLSKLCFATNEGVSLLGINDAANKLGLKTLCVKASMNELDQISLPAILHWNQKHFVVLYKIKKGRKYYIADPGKGLTAYTNEEMREYWLSTNSKGVEKGVVMMLEPASHFYDTKNASGTNEKEIHSFRFLYGYVRRYYKYFGMIAVGLALGSIIQLVLPFLTQAIVDKGIKHQDLNIILLILFGQLMLTISRTVIDFLRRWILLRISMKINISLISDFFIKLLKLPMSFFDTKLMGDLMQRMNDHGRVNNFLTQDVLNIVFSLLTLIVFSVVLVIYDKLVFLAFLIGSMLYGVWVALFLKRRKVIDYELFEQQAINNNRTYEFITSMQEIKLQDCEQRKRQEWEHIQKDLFKIQQKSLRLQQQEEAGGIFINELKNIAITVMSAAAVIEGNMTLGMMLAVQYIIGQLCSPVEQLMDFFYSIQDVKISLERINEIHSMEDENGKAGLLTSIEQKSKGINIQNVIFKYNPHVLTKTIDHVDIQIPQGKVTAIVGASGSGKTTLINLLMRFYEVNSGAILIDGVETKHMTRHSLRQNFGMVLQETWLKSGTIRENICMGKPDATEEEMILAAKAAHAHTFIQQLPQGYDTEIRDGGNLSQGQKQLLCIARVMLCLPPMLILDEATSSIDTRTEVRIQEAFATMMKGRTSFIVAHRLSTIREADVILVMKDGHIIEQGNHETLLEKNGFYAKLYRSQFVQTAS